MERSKVSQLRLAGEQLRAELEATKDQPIPEAWLDLIRRLDDKERQKSTASPAEPSRQTDKK
jgi:hypothetical protein